MRVLLLTPRLPWPPLDGGRVAMARLAEALVRAGAEVEVLSLNPRKHRGVAAGPLPVHAVDIDTARVIAPLLSRKAPFVVARFISAEFEDALGTTLDRFQPDIVQVESPFLLPYLDRIRAQTNAPVVLRSLNVEFTIWEGLARIERNRLRRFALNRIAFSLRAYELREMEQCDAIVPISDADADQFRALGCTRPMHVVPCGVMLPDPGDVVPSPLRVGFMGSLDFLPNQQAVTWILDELWPRVIAQLPDARLAIAGRSTPDWLQRRALDPSVELLGEIADAAAFIRSVSVFIAPLFAGGGMRIKVLDAMSLGKPVVATALGAGGIDVQAGRDVLLAEDAISFADAIVRLLREPDTAAKLGAAARANVAARYDNDALARGLLQFYASL